MPEMSVLECLPEYSRAELRGPHEEHRKAHLLLNRRPRCCECCSPCVRGCFRFSALTEGSSNWFSGRQSTGGPHPSWQSPGYPLQPCESRGLLAWWTGVAMMFGN